MERKSYSYLVLYDAGNEVYCRQDNHLAYGANRHKRKTSLNKYVIKN